MEEKVFQKSKWASFLFQASTSALFYWMWYSNSFLLCLVGSCFESFPCCSFFCNPTVFTPELMRPFHFDLQYLRVLQSWALPSRLAFLLRFAPDLNPPAIPGLASHDQRLLTHPGLCQAVQSLSDVDRSRRTRMRSLNSFHLLLTVQSSMSWKCRNLSLPSRKSK